MLFKKRNQREFQPTPAEIVMTGKKEGVVISIKTPFGEGECCHQEIVLTKGGLHRFLNQFGTAMQEWCAANGHNVALFICDECEGSNE